MSETQYEYSDKDTLLHYGVLGMKWGVRKDRRTGKRVGTPVKGTKAARRDQPSVSPKPKSSSSRTKTMSTPELQEKVNRIRLEQEYKRLTAAPPTQKSRVRKAAEDVLYSVGKRQVEHVLNSSIQSYSNRWLRSVGIEPLGGDKKKKK